MATYRDPVNALHHLKCSSACWKFVPKRVLLPPFISFHPMTWQTISMRSASTSMHSLSRKREFHFGDYRAPLAPGGDHAHNSLTAH